MSEQRLEQLEKTINGHILENKDKMGKQFALFQKMKDSIRAVQASQLKQIDQGAKGTEQARIDAADQAIKYTELQALREDFSNMQVELREQDEKLRAFDSTMGTSINDFKDETKETMIRLDQRFMAGLAESRDTHVDKDAFSQEVQNIQGEVYAVQQKAESEIQVVMAKLDEKIRMLEDQIVAKIEQ